MWKRAASALNSRSLRSETLWITTTGSTIGAGAPAQAAAIVQGRPEPVRANLVAALDRCLGLAPKGDAQTREWLLATLDAADSDPWRMRVRRAMLDGDGRPWKRWPARSTCAANRRFFFFL